jgi:outer membrane protein assembly factor BamA
VRRPASARRDHRPAIRSFAVRVALLLVLLASSACNKQRPDRVPGETDITIESITFRAPGPTPLALDHAPLLNTLGMRAGNFLIQGRTYSQFREAEDRRRIAAYWQTYGYFDVEVLEPAVQFDKPNGTVSLTWTVNEGPRYTIASVHLLHALPEHEKSLQALIPFKAGEATVDLEAFRKVRHAMGDRLRRQGFGHATVYSRTFVDRQKKQIAWYYYVDTGPKTRVGKITVTGSNKVPADVILERVGLRPGDPYDLESKEMAEIALLDTGAFASAFIQTNAEVEFIVPGDAPDTGGALGDAQVDAEGNLVPRKLPETIDLIVHVVESPSQQLRVRAGFEFDSTRVDTFLDSELWLRNLFAPQHHLTLEGRVGYGWLWRGDTDDPTGLYGDALVRYTHPGFLARLLDLRLTARYRDVLYPGFHLREVTAGPGVRSTLARSLYFDTDLFFRYGQQVDFGPFDAAALEELSLPSSDTSYGGELDASLVWDNRDSAVEPMRGQLLALRAALSPGEPLGTHRWLGVSPEARAFLPLGPSISIGLRASAGWVFLGGDEGIPLGPRLFGGGAYGMRGFGRQQLSPTAVSCVPDPDGGEPRCEDTPVGGLSLFEGSIEARFLPQRKQYGAVLFADAGNAGAAANPFEDGVSLAFGLGLRLRLWYLPIALDAAYRLLDDNVVQRPSSLDPFQLFLRIGEAF